MDLFNEDFKINKKIRLIELFAGIGAQSASLRNLGVDFETHRVCEFNTSAVKSYNAVHGTDYQPSDVRDIHPCDLGMTERDKYCYILTYSFPCTDLSLAGKRMGMGKGSGTRSGLLWEVERILEECGGDLPDVLLMENVPQVHGAKSIDDFKDWVGFLSRKGYSNFYEDLNAKDFGVPQHRERTFMVSLLGDYDYEFPKGIPLERRLVDVLEDEVDEKYYLSIAQVERILVSSYSQKKSQIQRKDYCDTILARDWKDPKCVQVGSLSGGKWDKKIEMSRRVYSEEGLSPSITTCGGGDTEPKVLVSDRQAEIKYKLLDNGNIRAYRDDGRKSGISEMQIQDPNNVGATLTTAHVPKVLMVRNATKKGFDEAVEGDSVNLSYPGSGAMRGRIGHGVSQTLLTAPSMGVVVNKVAISKCENSRVIDVANCITARADRGVSKFSDTGTAVVCCGAIRGRKPDGADEWEQTLEINGSGLSNTVTTVQKDNMLCIMDDSYKNRPPRVYGDVCPTLRTKSDAFKVAKTVCLNSKVDGKQPSLQDRVYDPEGLATAVTTGFMPSICEESLRIRKLTPRECWRLMGFGDKDFDRAADAVSNTQLYMQAGNSIVVTVLMAIFSQLHIVGCKAWNDMSVEERCRMVEACA